MSLPRRDRLKAFEGEAQSAQGRRDGLLKRLDAGAAEHEAAMAELRALLLSQAHSDAAALRRAGAAVRRTDDTRAGLEDAARAAAEMLADAQARLPAGAGKQPADPVAVRARRPRAGRAGGWPLGSGGAGHLRPADHGPGRDDGAHARRPLPAADPGRFGPRGGRLSMTNVSEFADDIAATTIGDTEAAWASEITETVASRWPDATAVELTAAFEIVMLVTGTAERDFLVGRGTSGRFDGRHPRRGAGRLGGDPWNLPR